MFQTLTEYKNYFEEIATNHNGIAHRTTEKHFYSTVDEMIGTGLKPRIMVFNPAGFSFVDKKSDNVLRYLNLEVWILDSSPLENFNRQLEIYDECEEIARDIITYIQKDLNYSPTANRRITSFNIDNYSIEFIGPVHTDNLFGVSLKMSVGNPAKLVFNASKWT